MQTRINLVLLLFFLTICALPGFIGESPSVTANMVAYSAVTILLSREVLRQEKFKSGLQIGLGAFLFLVILISGMFVGAGGLLYLIDDKVPLCSQVLLLGNTVLILTIPMCWLFLSRFRVKQNTIAVVDGKIHYPGEQIRIVFLLGDCEPDIYKSSYQDYLSDVSVEFSDGKVVFSVEAGVSLFVSDAEKRKIVSLSRSFFSSRLKEVIRGIIEREGKGLTFLQTLRKLQENPGAWHQGFSDPFPTVASIKKLTAQKIS